MLIEMDFRVFILCFDRQVSVTSSSGILSVTLVEFGWAGEGPDSGCHRGREGEEDRCLKVILSTQTVENNKVIHCLSYLCPKFSSYISTYIYSIICLDGLKRPPDFVFIITITIQTIQSRQLDFIP